MSDLSLTNGECEDRHGPKGDKTTSHLTLTNGEREDQHGLKGLSIAEHVWMFHNGPSVYAVLYW